MPARFADSIIGRRGLRLCAWIFNGKGKGKGKGNDDDKDKDKDEIGGSLHCVAR